MLYDSLQEVVGPFSCIPDSGSGPRDPGLDAQHLLQWAHMDLDHVLMKAGSAAEKTFCSPGSHPLRPSLQARAAVVE